MVKRLSLSAEQVVEAFETGGRVAVFQFLVDWFPGLTDDQVVENLLAEQDGEPRPHDNPNRIEVALELPLMVDLAVPGTEAGLVRMRVAAEKLDAFRGRGG